MENSKEMRSQTSDSQLVGNIKLLVEKMTNDIIKKSYVINVDKETVNHLEFLEFTTTHLTMNGRKKLSKRIHHAFNKNGLRTINTFFSILRSRGIITSRVEIKISEKEAKINKLRIEYKKLRDTAELARLAYQTEKGDFYKY